MLDEERDDAGPDPSVRAGGGPDEAERWWRSGVLYQIYPRSFSDSDGDGHGDLQGVIDRLDHLEWLGVDAIWLNPIQPSPNADWGYDVADFVAVHPDYGDLATADRLVAEAAERGIRVMLDLVPNHTSDRHAWFVDARSDRASANRDRYVWADAKPDGSPPNNWRSTFGGPAWTWDPATGQFYLHNFLAEQPDLNWWDERVRSDFDAVLRFWMDRGFAGFRIDVANGLVKDRDLRDNPPVTDDDHPLVRRLGLRPVHNMNRPEVHDVFRRWRSITDAQQPPGVLLGETWVVDLPSLAAYYGSGSDELHLAMNFPFVFSKLSDGMRTIVEATEAALPPGAWPSWLGSNHDVGRFPTRWCEDDPRKTRSALLMLLTLRGTPILYAGDEIGMVEVAVPRERVLDPVGIRNWPEDRGRDGGRTPMQWTGEANGGFTLPGVEPWLPMGDAAGCNVAEQREDPASILHLCRDLIALRRSRADLRRGAYRTIEGTPGLWAWARGEHTVVAVNLSDEAAALELRDGAVLVGTRRERDGEPILGTARLEPWEGLVVSSEARVGDGEGGASIPHEELRSAVEEALRSHPGVRSVELVGSRSRGAARPLSDWDFVVVGNDTDAVVRDLPSIVAPLEPLAQQWDRLGPDAYSCYMLLLAGPRKIDLIFPGMPHRPAPPWVARPDSLEPIDRHFWDWILWIAAKRQGGEEGLVREQLALMSVHLLRPMGVDVDPGSIDEAVGRYLEARRRLEVRFGRSVPTVLQEAVLPAVSVGGPVPS